MKSTSPSRYGGLLVIVFFLVCLVFLKSVPQSWNDISRVAAIESLVERGTWQIDESAWAEQTGDKVLVNGHYYSDKTPLLTVAGAGVYFILHYGLGGLASPTCGQTFCVYGFLTLLLVTVPACILLWIFFKTQPDFISARGALVSTSALMFATMVLPYSVVLNHHLPAAVCLFASFFLLKKSYARSNAKILFGSGVLAGLSIALDPLAGFGAAALMGIALIRMRWRAWMMIASAFLPIAATALLDMWMFGTPIPAYLLTQGYVYPGSEFGATIAGNGTAANMYSYTYEMFVGSRGLFAYNPILLFAVVGLLWSTVKERNMQHVEALLVLGALFALSVYLVMGTNNFGGKAYGERWFISILPLVFYFILFAPPFVPSRLPRLMQIVFVAAFALSLYSALQGAVQPWGIFIYPPFHLP